MNGGKIDSHSIILLPYGLVNNHKERNQVLYLVEVTLCERWKLASYGDTSLFAVLRRQRQAPHGEVQAIEGYMLRAYLKL